MAYRPITWQMMKAPDFSGVNDLMTASQASFDKAAQSAQGAFDAYSDYYDRGTKYNNDDLIARLKDQYRDPHSFREAVDAGVMDQWANEYSRVNRDTLTFAGKNKIESEIRADRNTRDPMYYRDYALQLDAASQSADEEALKTLYTQMRNDPLLDPSKTRERMQDVRTKQGAAIDRNLTETFSNRGLENQAAINEYLAKRNRTLTDMGVDIVRYDQDPDYVAELASDVGMVEQLKQLQQNRLAMDKYSAKNQQGFIEAQARRLQEEYPSMGHHEAMLKATNANNASFELQTALPVQVQQENKIAEESIRQRMKNNRWFRDGTIADMSHEEMKKQLFTNQVIDAATSADMGAFAGKLGGGKAGLSAGVMLHNNAIKLKNKHGKLVEVPLTPLLASMLIEGTKEGWLKTGFMSHGADEVAEKLATLGLKADDYLKAVAAQQELNEINKAKINPQNAFSQLNSTIGSLDIEAAYAANMKKAVADQANKAGDRADVPAEPDASENSERAAAIRSEITELQRVAVSGEAMGTPQGYAQAGIAVEQIKNLERELGSLSENKPTETSAKTSKDTPTETSEDIPPVKPGDMDDSVFATREEEIAMMKAHIARLNEEIAKIGDSESDEDKELLRSHRASIRRLKEEYKNLSAK